MQKLYKDNEPTSNLDKGIFSIYFFNIVKAMPGEAVFQAAGLPHAYLEGQNVEIMANSDNVLRGGLTTKHIDVAELLKHTNFEETIPNILPAIINDKGIIEYPAAVEDFAINGVPLSKDDQQTLESISAEIFIVIKGQVEIDGSNIFRKGDSFFIKPGVKYTLKASVESLLYKAFVPA